MKLDSETNTFTFASRDELVELHDQVSALLRLTMMQATRHVEDPEVAKELSQKVMQEFRTVMRFLNVTRGQLPKKTF